MKTVYKSFFLSFLFLPFFLCSKIIEVDNIKELEQHIEHANLVLFDIDNTLMEPTQQLGSDQWFCSRIADYKELGMSKKDAIETALSEWVAIQNVTKVKLVENEAEAVVRKCQNQGITAMGLTTRGLGMSTRTVEQLKTLNVDFLHSAPVHHEVFFQNTRGCLMRGGILFTAATHKGRALFRLLDRVDYEPKSVVFINDKRANLREVEETCEERKIPFIGLRYGYLDEKVKHFRKEVSDLQMEHFGHILSDKDAEGLLKKEKKS